MKRVKMLLVVMLCVVMAFGAASVSASAEIIEVEKPAEPREVSVESINSSKNAYHTNDDIEFVIKFKDLTKEDIENIKSCVIHIRELSQGHYFDLDFPIIATYDKTINGFIGTINKKTELKEMNYILNVKYTMYFLHKDSTNSIEIKENSYNRKRITFTVNNNCADGNHTIYKDNWQTEEYATCVKKGLQTIRCNICNQIVKSEEIPMTSHKISGCQTRLYNGKQYFFYLCSCGKIMGKEPCSSKSNNKTSKNTANNKAITKLRFVKKSVTIKKGKTIKLKYICQPTNAKNKLIWKTSNPKIVKILNNSKVKGLKKGKATIILKSGNKKTKIVIKVK